MLSKEVETLEGGKRVRLQGNIGVIEEIGEGKKVCTKGECQEAMEGSRHNIWEHLK